MKKKFIAIVLLLTMIISITSCRIPDVVIKTTDEKDVSMVDSDEKDISMDDSDNILKNKSILAIGDSFVKGYTLDESETWVSKIAERNEMTKYIYATNGISVAGTNSETIAKQIDDIINDVSSVDYILFLGGHNDANATWNGGSPVPIGKNTDSTDRTYKGGLNIIINKLLTAYPTSYILFLTPFNRYEIEEPYVEAMKEVCGEYSVPCFDNYHCSGICFPNDAQSKVYELSDAHLNEVGQERISYLYESILKNNLAIG